MHASHAKINLGLKVNFKYPNGYHNISSLLIPIDLSDEMDIFFDHDKKSDCIKINWKDSLPGFFSDQLKIFRGPEQIKKNMIYRSYSWFFDWFENYIQQEARFSRGSLGLPYTRAKDFLKDIRSSQIIVRINKKIPSPAGLGGGSSNAAVILKEFLKKASSVLEMNYQVLLEVLSKDVVSLGADIPFFLQDRTALVSGIGNVEKQIKIPKFLGILGIPNFSFETQKIYQRLNSPLQKESLFKNSKKLGVQHFQEYFQSVIGLINKGEICRNEVGQLNFVGNDLLLAAESAYPEETSFIKKSMKDLARIMLQYSNVKGSIYASMSGSGASFFAMGDISKETQKGLLLKLKKDHPNINWYDFSTL